MIIFPANHFLYQLAMCCYFISYATTNILMLRFVLALASVFLSLWAILVLNLAVDTFVWNLVFFTINFSHGLFLLYQMRPIKFRNEDFEQVYSRIFAPPLTPMSRHEFLVLSKLGFIRELKAGSTFVDIGNKSHNLSVLVHGRIEAVNFGGEDKKEVIMNDIKPFEFIDSPQWMARRLFPVQIFPVTLRATEDCRFVMWPLESLDELIQKNPQYKAYLDSVVGCDVAQKLLEMDNRVKDDKDAAKLALMASFLEASQGSTKGGSTTTGEDNV